MYLKFIVILMSCLSILHDAYSATYVISSNSDLVGNIEYTTPEIGETISDVGIRYNVGYQELIRANPHIDPSRPLQLGTKITIPSQYILPKGPRSGIVINLAEFRLYYYPPGDNVVITMPVGIGREGWFTPIGQTKVIKKERDPVWRPTENVRAEAAKHGTPIPSLFPAGVGNPLGRHVLRLGWPTYLIHGTNRRDGVGSRVSAGCIRMMPEDIEELFDMISVGTTVTVVNEPVKLGRANSTVYLQTYPLLYEDKKGNLQNYFNQLVTGTGLENKLNKNIIRNVLSNPLGIPTKLN